MSKANKIKEWVSPLTVAHFLLMLNIGLNIFIKSERIYVWAERIGILFIVPAIILWILPVIILRSYGEVSEYGSFLATTKLVDKSIYAIIRHPQYLGFILLSIGMALFYQLDLTIILSLGTIVLLIFGIKEEEKYLMDQFGEDYEDYKKKVPSIAFFRGILRILIKGRTKTN